MCIRDRWQQRLKPHRQWLERLKPHTDTGQKGSTPTETLAKEAQASHRHWPERLNHHTNSGNRGSSPTQWQRRLKPHTQWQQRLKPHKTVATEAQPSTDSGHRETQPPRDGSTTTHPGVPVGARKVRHQRPFKATVKAALAPMIWRSRD